DPFDSSWRTAQDRLRGGGPIRRSWAHLLAEGRTGAEVVRSSAETEGGYEIAPPLRTDGAVVLFGGVPDGDGEVVERGAGVEAALETGRNEAFAPTHIGGALVPFLEKFLLSRSWYGERVYERDGARLLTSTQSSLAALLR